jgi:hypothetical protein
MLTDSIRGLEFICWIPSRRLLGPLLTLPAQNIVHNVERGISNPRDYYDDDTNLVPHLCDVVQSHN